MAKTVETSKSLIEAAATVCCQLDARAVFVHADADERLIRRVRRDIKERGRDIDEVLSRYQSTLKPMHQQFIEPTKNYADIIIPNDRYNTVAIDIVRTVINDRL